MSSSPSLRALLLSLVLAGCSEPESVSFPDIAPADLGDWQPDFGEESDLGESLEPVTSDTVLDYVDPFIGTGGLGFAYGGLTPAAQAPLGMIRVGPDTSEGSNYSTLIDRFSGYRAQDPNTRGFSHLHFVGTGVADYGNLRVLPTTREVSERPYRSWYATHQNQAAGPGWYRSELDEGEVGVELVAGIRSAIHHYTFGAAGEDNIVLIDPTSSLKDSGVEAATWSINGTTFETELTYRGSYVGRTRPFTLWASIELSETPESVEIWDDEASQWSAAANGVDAPARLVFSGDEVVLKVGISFQSMEQARENRLEATSRDELLETTESAWKELLSRVLVEGGEELERTLFYTALYNCFRMPTRLDEAGRYRGLDGELHELSEGRYFTDLSLWDTYRTLHPLWTLIAPEAQRDALNSLIRMGEDGGFIPRWPAALSYTSGMEGEPAMVMFGESAAKGLDGVDYQRAWELFDPVADASAPEGGYDARRGIERYAELGWLPADEFSSAASNTLEWSVADYGLAQLTNHLGLSEESARFRERADSWKNIYREDEGFFWPRNADGSWAELRSKTAYNERSGIFVEGSAWHYRFYPLHDPEGLRDLMGAETMEAALDEFFEESRLFEITERTQLALPDPYYWHSNQPSIHTVSHYAALGRLDKLSEWTRAIQYSAYAPTPDGLPGNDDGGTMSAWFVWSAIGLYPVVGTANYVPMPPLFPKITIKLEDSTLVIEAPGASRTVGKLVAADPVPETIAGQDINLVYTLEAFD